VGCRVFTAIDWLVRIRGLYCEVFRNFRGWFGELGGFNDFMICFSCFLFVLFVYRKGVVCICYWKRLRAGDYWGSLNFYFSLGVYIFYEKILVFTAG